MKKPELLSPAGDYASLIAAIKSGADAVYFGIDELNMRMNAKNFRLSEINKIVDLCHKNHVKAYLTLNTIVYDEEIKRIKKILDKAKKSKIDAIIAWDLSIINEARKRKIPVHLSTQASISNTEAARFFKKLGVNRIVLARELNLEQIKKIKKNLPKLEIECFVHGAMCVSISGRCLISHSLFGKSANRGECLQPCRRKYKIVDVEEGHELELGESQVISPKDLCALSFIDKLIEAKIDAFKIEGRNRSPEYVKTVVECYRKAIDSYFEKKFNKKLAEELIKKLKTVYNRNFSSGFFMGKPINEWVDVHGSKAVEKKMAIGMIANFYSKKNVANIKILSCDLKTGDRILIIGDKTGVIEEVIESMEINHRKIEIAKKGQNVGVLLKNKAREGDEVYKVIESKKEKV